MDGGYEIVEREPVDMGELVDMLVERSRRMDEAQEFCAMTGGHEPGDENRDCCRKCTAPIA